MNMASPPKKEPFQAPINTNKVSLHLINFHFIKLKNALREIRKALLDILSFLSLHGIGGVSPTINNVMAG